MKFARQAWRRKHVGRAHSGRPSTAPRMQVRTSRSAHSWPLTEALRGSEVSGAFVCCPLKEKGVRNWVADSGRWAPLILEEEEED